MGLAREEGSSDAVFPVTQVIIMKMKLYMDKEVSAVNWEFINVLQSIGMTAVDQASGFKQERVLFSAKTQAEVKELLLKFPRTS